MRNSNVRFLFRPPTSDFRPAFTLVELLLATVLTVMVVAAVGALSKTVQIGTDYSHGHSEANQHARVALERIVRNVEHAAATENSPGFAVLAAQVGIWRFPDTLVVWKSDANKDNFVQVNELVIYCPNPDVANELLEITVPTDTRVVPDLNNELALEPFVTTLKNSAAAERVVLTTLLRSCVSPGAGVTLRGALRFEGEMNPSESDWLGYKAATIAWINLPWPQGIYGTTTGVRHNWLRVELQLMPGADAGSTDPWAQQAIPFFGSASVTYSLNK